MSDLVLAFDTSTEVCAVALGMRLGESVEVVLSVDLDAPRAAMAQLLPSVVDLLAGAGVALRQVSEVVVGRGPGSFTGVRIGVATAKGLAHGLGVPLYGVGTLDAIAWAFAGGRLPSGSASGETGLSGSDVTSGEGDLLGVVGDAMRGEVYPGLFRFEAGRPVRLGSDRVARPREAATDWAQLDAPIALAGNGLAKHQEDFLGVLGTSARIMPAECWGVTGLGLLRAYEASLRQGTRGPGEAGELLPIYTRLSDAEQAERDKHGRAPAPTPESGVHGPGSGGGGGLSDASV